MNDNFSLDDILKEVDGKKATRGDSELGEGLTAELAAIDAERFGERAKPPKQSQTGDLSVTQILSQQAAKPASTASPGTDLTATQIIDSQMAEKLAKESAEAAYIEATGELPPMTPQPVQIKRFAPKKRDDSAKSAGVSKPPKTAKPPKPAKQASTAEVEIAAAKSAVSSNSGPLEMPSKPTYSPPSTGDELTPEEQVRLQKLRDEELLAKELALEDPDELIDGINPYDVKEIGAGQADSPVADAVSVRTTQDLGNSPLPSNAPDTLERPSLKEVDSANTRVLIEEPEEPEDDVKKFSPKSGISVNFLKPPKPSKPSLPPTSGDKYEELNITPLLESLNKNFVEQRKENINARKTLNVDTLSSVTNPARSHKNKTIPVLNIDYKKQIIADSGVLPPAADIKLKQLEKQDLAKKKKRKIRDFIYEDIDEDDDDFYYDDDEIDNDYDSFDSSEQVWNDLNESHKGLKWRFGLLFLLTAILGVFTVIHDFGLPVRVSLIEAFGGLTRYSTALIFANIIAGVIGICLCSGVVIRGMKNLFLGRADCDSACAVPILATTLAPAVFLGARGSHELLLQNGRIHLYVVVALAALMFNTLGKIFMIVRTKKNFAFISGDNVKYSAYMPNPSEERAVRDFTKGILHDIPSTVFLRKTEFLTDYLKNSYCTDWADLICRKLVPISAIVAFVVGVAAFFLPMEDALLSRTAYWAFTAGGAFIVALSPFSIMFLVNNPLLKAAKALSPKDCVVMGYTAASKFSKANAVVIDAGLLFPAGSVRFLNVKRCQKPNAINAINIDEAIVIAASLAIKSDSIMSSMFYDMISGDKDLLYKVEGCVYEVNMGITGWMGTKKVMLGNRAQMKHHGVDVPAENKERTHCPDNGEIVYLAVGSESVAMFIIEVVANPAVKHSLWELDANGIVLAVKTKDSLVTVAKLADVYDLNPEKVKILTFDQHTSFDDFSRYTSRGGSEIACNGTFTSFAKALVTAKNLIRDMMVTSATLFVSLFIAGIAGLMFVIFAGSGTGLGTEGLMSASNILIYNSAWLAIMFILQGLRRY
jgi:Cu+-exporting ATPase